MPTETTSSTITFTSPDPDVLVVDGVLVDGTDIYAETSSALSFSEDADGEDSWATDSEIEFGDILCVSQDFILATSSALAFSDGTTRRYGDFRDYNENQDGLDDPPTGFKFTVIKKRKLSSELSFVDSATISGGYILDLTCNPPKLVPNFMTWSTLDDDDWARMGDVDWSELGD